MNPPRGPRIILRPVTRTPISSTLNPDPTPVKLEPEENCCKCTCGGSNSNVSTLSAKDEKRFVCRSCPFPLELPDEHTYLRHMDLAHLFNPVVIRTQGLEEQAQVIGQGHGPPKTSISKPGPSKTSISKPISQVRDTCNSSSSTSEQVISHPRDFCQISGIDLAHLFNPVALRTEGLEEQAQIVGQGHGLSKTSISRPILQVCVMCNSSFSTFEQLLYHKRNSCEIPNVRLTQEAGMKKAGSIKDPEKRSNSVSLSCQLCSDQPHFPSGIELLYHNQTCHPLDSITSERRDELLGESTTPKAVLINLRRQEIARFLCRICSQMFALSSKVLEHEKKHVSASTEPHSKGKTCKKLSSSRATVQRTFDCSNCGKRYLTVKGMKTHKKKPCNASDYKFSCESCSNVFKTEGDLQSHKTRVHTVRCLTKTKKAKEFKCKVCGKVYKRSKARKNHMHIHSTVHQHQCQNCTKFFNDRTSLLSHQRKPCDKSQYSFKCSVCSNVFANQGALKRHVIYYHPDSSAKNSTT